MFQWVLNRFSDDTIREAYQARYEFSEQAEHIESDNALTSEVISREEWWPILNYLKGKGYMEDHLTDREIQAECEKRDIPRFQEPLEKVNELEDTKGNIYAWEVDSEEKRDRWLKALAEYQETNGEFKSVHFVLTDSEELHRLDKDDLEPYL